MRKILYVLATIVGISFCASCEEDEWEQEAAYNRLIGRWEMESGKRHNYLELHRDGEFIRVKYDDNYKDCGENDYRYKDTTHGKWGTSIHKLNEFWYDVDYTNYPFMFGLKGGYWEIEWKNHYQSFIFDGYRYDKVSGDNWK